MTAAQNNKPALRFPEFTDAWHEKKLGANCYKINSGKTPLGGGKNYKESGIVLIRSQNIVNNRLDLSNAVYISEKINDTMKNSIVKNDDILLNITGASLGRSCVVPKDFKIGNVNQHVCIIRPKHNISSSFLQSIISSEKGLRRLVLLQTGSGREGLNFESIKSYKISFPSLPEQEKIADFLSTVDGLIHNQSQRITALEQYKKGVMQQIFSQQIRFTPAKGEAYPDWEEKKLGETAIFRRGSFPQPYGLPEWYDEVNGFPFIQVYDVDENMKLKLKTKNRISSKAAQQSVFVKKGTLIVTIQGSIGRVAITQYDAYIDRTLLIFQRFKLDINIDFFKYIIYLLFVIEKEKAPGGTIKTITKEVLSDFDIYLPSIEEQNSIADFLSSIDAQLEAYQAQLSQLKTWKKGLLQQMLV